MCILLSKIAMTKKWHNENSERHSVLACQTHEHTNTHTGREEEKSMEERKRGQIKWNDSQSVC